MYTLKEVLELVNAGEDIYCEVFRTNRFITDGFISDLDLESDTKIEMYRLDYSYEGDPYLVLHLAQKQDNRLNVLRRMCNEIT